MVINQELLLPKLLSKNYLTRVVNTKAINQKSLVLYNIKIFDKFEIFIHMVTVLIIFKISDMTQVFIKSAIINSFHIDS